MTNNRVKQHRQNNCLGLVLSGGGARGAYQAGVLKALAEIANPGPVPFPVLTGVSVGALNTVGLASNYYNFLESATLIERFWRGLRSDQVFRTGSWKLARAVALYFGTSLLPGLIKHPGRSLLDNSPLRLGLSEVFQFEHISLAIANHGLKAIGLSCSGYESGQAVTFFEADPSIEEWQRVRRSGRRSQITLDHAMASAALPLIFEAVQIGNEYFGDGHLRLVSPVAPAIHLGADRVLIVTTRDREPRREAVYSGNAHYPTLADLGGYGLDILFHDSLDADIERLERINHTISRLAHDEDETSNLKHIHTLVFSPSRSLSEIAFEQRSELPFSLRWISRGSRSKLSGGNLESYLLFEPGYINTLLDLGYRDTMSRKAEVKTFLAT